MYLVRAGTERPLLNIELSGHVTTGEAARMLKLAAELQRTEQHRAIYCDLTNLDYGPDRPGAIAAVLAALLPAGVRVAIVGRPPALRGAARIVRLARATDAIRLFQSAAAADHWLADVAGVRTALPATAQRHADDLLGIKTARDTAPTRTRSSAA